MRDLHNGAAMSFRGSILACVIGSLLTGVAPTGVAGGSDVQLARLITALGEYVVRFEGEFSSAVAEERYVQVVRPVRGTPVWPSDERALEWHDGAGAYPRTGDVFDRRQLLSDVLLVQTRAGWLGYRDVAEVDGEAVRRREDRVTALFLSSGADRDRQLGRIMQESARYNLGAFRRTLNIPTVALSFLHTQHHARYTFSGGVRERLGGQDTSVVRFEEHRRPTLIGTPEGDDVPLAGRIWIDLTSHAVVQTEIALLIGDRRATLLTRYRREPGFDVLVPDYMWEFYDAEKFRSDTVVECLARYGHYRRFAVTTEQKIRQAR